MRRKLFIKVLWAFSFLVLGICSGCMEHAFPNDDLDFYWRLDRIEYKDGMDFLGNPCQSKDVDNIMFGFARHIVLIEAPGLSQQHGTHSLSSASASALTHAAHSGPWGANEPARSLKYPARAIAR